MDFDGEWDERLVKDDGDAAWRICFDEVKRHLDWVLVSWEQDVTDVMLEGFEEHLGYGYFLGRGADAGGEAAGGDA